MPTNQLITFYLHIDNNTYHDVDGMMNGFRVYSPDGATWSGTVGDTLTTLNWDERFDLTFQINYFSETGSGADTVGFGGSRLFNTGLPWWFDDTAYTITIGPIATASVGKTICLDSSFFLPSGIWKWSVAQAGSFYPSWDGPHCYEVGEDTTLVVTGELHYYNPRFPGPSNHFPMRDIEVQLWDEDWDEDDFLAVTTVNDDGVFQFDTVTNNDYGGSGHQDIYLKIFAHNDAGFVTTNATTLPKWHIYSEPTIDNVASGTYDYGLYVVPVSKSGPFHIVDRLLDGYRTWLDSTFIRTEIGSCPVVLGNQCGSYYDGTNPLTADHIVVDTSDYPLKGAPDTYDEHVILHEHGHWLAYHCFNFFDESEGGTHYWDSLYSLELAAAEGFSHFWSAVVGNDPHMRNWWNNFNSYDQLNVENGEHSPNGIPINSANNYGTSCEAAVAGILWDICDIAPDNYDSFGDFTFPRQPADSIGDSLADGMFGILEALLDDDRKIGGHHPDNIEEFWDAWFTEPALGHPVAMGDIWYEHGDSTHLGCCMGDMRGNVDYDATDAIDISDLIYLVDYMFVSGPEPPCMAEAALTGDPNDDVDISDLVWLVDYMFTGGPEPWPCP